MLLFEMEMLTILIWSLHIVCMDHITIPYPINMYRYQTPIEKMLLPNVIGDNVRQKTFSVEPKNVSCITVLI
jgi:hypothetical protein